LSIALGYLAIGKVFDNPNGTDSEILNSTNRSFHSLLILVSTIGDKNDCVERFFGTGTDQTVV
jgi:hypothetical protein